MYNEYRASEGKVLLNTSNMSWGHIICSSRDLSDVLFECDKKIAEQYCNEFQEYVLQLSDENVDNIKLGEVLNKTNNISKARTLSDDTVEELTDTEVKVKNKRDEMIANMFLNNFITANNNIIKTEH